MLRKHTGLNTLQMEWTVRGTFLTVLVFGPCIESSTNGVWEVRGTSEWRESGRQRDSGQEEFRCGHLAGTGYIAERREGLTVGETCNVGFGKTRSMYRASLFTVPRGQLGLELRHSLTAQQGCTNQWAVTGDTTGWGRGWQRLGGEVPEESTKTSHKGYWASISSIC
jgi:hypothetical protein